MVVLLFTVVMIRLLGGWVTDYHSMCEVVVTEEVAKEEKRGGNSRNKLGGDFSQILASNFSSLNAWDILSLLGTNLGP
jgi:hypothetical protein